MLKIRYFFFMVEKLQASQTLRLPFIGSRLTGELFEYLLLKMNAHSALISIPSWLVDRTLLNGKEEINLHVKQLLKDKYLVTENIEGIVHLLESNRKGIENLYRVELKYPLRPLSKAVKHHSAKETKDVLVRLVKDSMLIKNGVYIYLKHLIPYLSRVIHMEIHRFQALKDHMLSNIHQNVYEHMVALENLYVHLDAQVKFDSEALIDLDFEALRNFSYSEIHLNLFALALHYQHTKEDEDAYAKDPLVNPFYSTQPQNMYVNAIKLAESRLYDNYNYAVALYAELIKAAVPNKVHAHNSPFLAAT